MHRPFAVLPSFLFLACLTTPAASGAAPRLDHYGDPLPPGAVFRIGTTRLRRTVSDDRHLPQFHNVLLSPDGKFLLSSAEDEHNVFMWETATGREVRRFGGWLWHPKFSLSVDGALLVVSSENLIHFYDTATGKKQRTIDLYNLKIPRMNKSRVEFPFDSFSPDGKFLTAFHIEGWPQTYRILRWETATGKLIAIWETGTDQPLALSRDARLVAAMRADDSHISLWETASGKKVREWKALGKVPLQTRWLIFSPDGRSLVTADGEGRMREYDTATGKEARRWNAQVSAFPRRPATFAPDDKTLASVDPGFVLRLRDWKTGRVLRSFENVSGPAAFSRDGKILAAGGADSRLRLWDAVTGRDLCPFPDPGAITSLHFSPDRRVLAVESEESPARLLDSASGRLLKRYPDYRTLAFSPDGGSLLVQRRGGSYGLLDAGTGKERVHFRDTDSDSVFGGWDAGNKRLVTFAGDSVRVWDTATGKKRRELPVKKGCFYTICSPDARLVALADTNVIRLFATDTGKELHQFPSVEVNYDAQGENVNIGFGGFLSPLFSPNGQVLLAGFDRQSFGLWDVASGKRTLRWNCAEILPAHPVFSPDGKWLALPDTHGNPCLVDAATGKVRHRLARKGGDLRILLDGNRAFSQDSRLLAAAYDVHTLVLWETATGRPIRTWSGHSCGQLRQMTFSSDSRRLATVCTDGTALVWDVMGLSADGQLPARKLTPAETEQAWNDLGNADAAKAHRAIWMLVADPARALPLLRQRLHPARGAEPRRLAKLIADLDSEDFAERETAVRELVKLRELAQPALRAALQGKPSLELRRRVQGLLDELDSATPSAERLRSLRAVAALEYMGNEESRQLLAVWADGAPEARLTQDAKASLARRRSRNVHP